MSKPKTPLCDRLAELKTKAAKLRQDERELHQEREDREREGAQLAEAILNSKASAMAGVKTSEDVEQLTARAERVGAALADSSALTVAQRASAMVRSEIEDFATANSAGLLAEIKPSALAAQAGFTQWLEGFEAVGREWLLQSERASEVLRLARDRSPREMSAWDPRGGDLRSAVRAQLAAGVPVPLPHPPQVATVIPEDDPDPAIREAARLKAA